jgi:hypothetical protein
VLRSGADDGALPITDGFLAWYSTGSGVDAEPDEIRIVRLVIDYLNDVAGGSIFKSLPRTGLSRTAY